MRLALGLTTPPTRSRTRPPTLAKEAHAVGCWSWSNPDSHRSCQAEYVDRPRRYATHAYAAARHRPPALTTWPTSAMQISLCWRTPYSRDSVQVTERKCECHEHSVIIGSANADNARLHGGTMQPYHCRIQYHILLCAVCLDAPSVPILRATFSPANKRKPATISPSTATIHADARPRLGGLGGTFESHLSHHSYIGNSVNMVNFDSSSTKENSSNSCLMQ